MFGTGAAFGKTFISFFATIGGSYFSNEQHNNSEHVFAMEKWGPQLSMQWLTFIYIGTTDMRRVARTLNSMLRSG